MKKSDRNVLYGVKLCEEEQKKRRLSNEKSNAGLTLQKIRRNAFTKIHRY